ncbi:MAG: CoA-transferase [Solirubrobacteraceae bacterium]
MSPPDEAFSRDELLAAYVAGQIENGDRLFVGANLPVPRAGNLLAHLTHGPDIKVSVGMVSTNLLNEPILEPLKFSTDYRMARFAEAVVVHNDIFDAPRKVSDLFFVGGIQIDRYGNTNLIGLGEDYARLRFRGPGTLGTASMAYYAKRYYIYAQQHSPRVFVERCDFVSVFGHGEGADHRARLGLDRFNRGPTSVITPLAILDFETPDHRMRIQSVHPGVSVDDVHAATGFELEVPPDVAVTPEPTAEQIALLRERIDVEGLLRR